MLFSFYVEILIFVFRSSDDEKMEDKIILFHQFQLSTASNNIHSRGAFKKYTIILIRIHAKTFKNLHTCNGSEAD